VDLRACFAEAIRARVMQESPSMKDKQRDEGDQELIKVQRPISRRRTTERSSR